MSDDLLESRLCTALMRVGTRMAAGFDQHFEPLGVTQAQFRMLLAVHEQGGHGGIAPSRLADFLLIERATVSSLTTTLVARGWLERRPGASRRTHLLALTSGGQELLGLLIPRAVALAELTLNQIPASQLRNFHLMLEQVESKLRAGLKDTALS